MSATALTPLQLPSLPIEASCIVPDRFADLSERQVTGLPLLVGNEQVELGTLFRVRGAGSEKIRIEGDVARVKYIGAGMTRGSILVEGSVGMHAGARLRGGTFEVRGDADAWAGAEMSGGLLRIGGNAGDHAGAAYPGSRRGMTGGLLLVDGRAGSELGAVLRRGVIAVRGRAGDYAGFNMIAGSIILCGGADRRSGAGMKRGSIMSFEPLDLPPTFRYACTYRPEYAAVFFRHLGERYGFTPPDRHADGRFTRYSGDLTELGKGEVLIWTPTSA